MNAHVSIELYKGNGTQPYRWRLRSPNGRVLADSAEGYATVTSVRRAVLKLGEWTARGVVVKDELLPARPPAPSGLSESWSEAAARAVTTIRGWVIRKA